MAPVWKTTVWKTTVDAINAEARRVPSWAMYLAGALPAAWLVWLLLTGGLGVEPINKLERGLGERALQLLVLGLCITPLRRFAGINLIRFRRAIGVLAFVYVALHLATWIVLDMGFLWKQMLADIVKRPYVTVGMAAFAMLLPLAATSNNWSVRRLGAARWQSLHRLVYLAAVAGGVHYLWLVKAFPVEPMLYLIAIVGLLALRAKLRPARGPQGLAGALPAAAR